MTKWKVLVVEDEEKIRSLVELYLVHNEFDVVTAENGEKAIEKAEKERPDLVVLDILLPDISGFDVCKKLRSMQGFEEIPIIFLSGLQETEAIAEGLNIGGNDYITKPFDPNVLVARINAVFRRIQDGQGVEREDFREFFKKLTSQERQILQCMDEGFTNKEIAGKLGLAEGKVGEYNQFIFEKLEVRNRTQAIVRAKEIGFL